LPRCDRLAERLAVEVAQARPEGDEGRPSRLRLKRCQVLDRGDGLEVGAFEQGLARERGTVQLALREHVHSRGKRSMLRNAGKATKYVPATTSVAAPPMITAPAL